MADDAMRAFLRSLRTFNIGVPSGHVGIARSVVEEAGADLDAVDFWVEVHGGRVVRSHYESKALGGGRWQRRRQDTSHYLIPAAALRQPG